MSKAPVRLCVFVRTPVLGAVKTRLARTMGPAAALQAYERLVDHALLRLQALSRARIELWVAGDLEHPQVLSWARQLGAAVRAQSGQDLGERMYHALFDPAAAADTEQAIVMGTDCPTIDAKLIEQASTALRKGAQVALAPAEDGGYGLIAMQVKPRRRLTETPFAGITWGTASVYSDTVALCRTLDLPVSTLEQVWDVDIESDWLRFTEQFGRSPGP